MKMTSTPVSRFNIAWLSLLLLLGGLISTAAEKTASEDDYASFVRDSVSSAKNAAAERLRRVEEAQAAFRGVGRQPQSGEGENLGERQSVEEQGNRQADSRETMTAALLAVYDANENGCLDADELARVRIDRWLVAEPPSPVVVRWKRLEARIAANEKIAAEEKTRILESIRRRIDEAERNAEAGGTDEE